MSKINRSTDYKVIKSLADDVFKFFTSEGSFRISISDKYDIEKKANRIVNKASCSYVSPQTCERELVELLKLIESAVHKVPNKMDTSE